MMNSQTVVESLSSSELRAGAHELVRRSRGIDAQLLVYLGEIDERKLYLEWTFSSMFAFCVGELGFSEDVACNRIAVARAARRTPVILEALRSGKVHLAGLRLLAPHLTAENQERVVAPLTEETFKFQFTGSRACMTCSERRRICSGTESRTGTWQPSSKRRWAC
jgi:hypothetical protein